MKENEDLKKQYSKLANENVQQLTKREYFALMAFQGLISGQAIKNEAFGSATERAVKAADNLLFELAKEQM